MIHDKKIIILFIVTMLIIPGLFSVSQVKGSLYVKILNIADTWKKVIKPNATAYSEITDKNTLLNGNDSVCLGESSTISDTGKTLIDYDDTLDSETVVTYPPSEITIQYRETDFNFISRLMEEEGIFYFFNHNSETSEDKDTIFDFIWKLHLTFQFLRYKISKISYNGK